MTSEGRKALAFFAGTALVGALVVGFGVRVLGMAAGPESEIISQLKQTETGGLQLTVPGASTPLKSTRHRFERVVVETDLEDRTGIAVATLDLEGTLGGTRWSSLGLERIPFTWRDGDWAPVDGYAPSLVEIASVLEARRRAVEEGDIAALAKLSGRSEEAVRADPEVARVLALEDRRYGVEAWFVRSERDEVLVGEDFRLQGDSPDRPVDERGTRRLFLRRTGGKFLLDGGLM